MYAYATYNSVFPMVHWEKTSIYVIEDFIISLHLNTSNKSSYFNLFSFYILEDDVYNVLNSVSKNTLNFSFLSGV